MVNFLTVVVGEIFEVVTASVALNHVTKGLNTIPSSVAFTVIVNLYGCAHALFAIVFNEIA